MSWEKAEDEARKWALGSDADFALTAADKEARKINFRAPCGSFYVTVPEKTGEEEWVYTCTNSHLWLTQCCAVSPLCTDGVE